MLPTLKKFTLGSFNKWERNQINRVEKLSDQQVLQELREIMCGRKYSWRVISKRLQERLDRKMLVVEHFEAGNIPYEWNVLCDEKVSWDNTGGPSFNNCTFNRICLRNLKIIPTQAGLGFEGRRLVSANFDFRLPLVARLAVYMSDEDAGQEFRAKTEDYPLFYAEGPEFRIEYIHHRVEY